MSLSAKLDDPSGIDSSQLGPEAVITFSHGLVGQPNWKRFVLITADDDASVAVLQSVDNERLSLMVISPQQVVPDYAPVLTKTEWTTLGLEADEQPVVLTTLSVHDDQISANLLGPLVINPRTREAMQVVLADSAYSTRHIVGRLDPPEPE